MVVSLVRLWRFGFRIAGTLAVALALLAAAVGSAGTGLAAESACSTPFVFFIDPANPGTPVTRGPITTVRDSGVLGAYGGDGRFTGYSIDGVQTLIVNTAESNARVSGALTATSPDKGSTSFVRYRGDVDLATGVASGSFIAFDATGDLEGFHAGGTIAAELVGTATFNGADVGLC